MGPDEPTQTNPYLVRVLFLKSANPTQPVQNSLVRVTGLAKTDPTRPVCTPKQHYSSVAD